jgi:hypothetical protein
LDWYNILIVKYRQINKNLSEEELQKKLLLNLMGIAVIILIAILSLFVFAPKIGYLFGLVSKHRNEEGYKPTSKIPAPVFAELPKSVKTEQVSFKGYTQSGLTVKLFVNGPEKATTVSDADGKFEFTNVTLNEGKNTLFARSDDGQGNESESTELFFIELDKNAPKIDELSPKDGDTVRNLDKRITITGKINEKAGILINGKTAIQKSDYTFEFLLGVEEGNVKIKIEVTDEAGNKTEKEITVKYEKKSV